MGPQGPEDRTRLGATFDAASDVYQRSLPDHPDALITRVVEVTGLAPGGHLLGIGCATGKATLPFARRGFRLTCIEPGPNLAEVARRNLSPFPKANVVQAPEGQSYDVVFAVCGPGS